MWDQLPREVQQQIIDKRLKFFVVDGHGVARRTGMGGRINTVMQTCFFALAGRAAARGGDRAHQGKRSARRTASGARRSSSRISRRSTWRWRALHEVKVPASVDEPQAAAAAGRRTNESDFVKRVTAAIIAGRGDLSAGERDAGRRHVSHRHRQVRKAQHRGGDSDLGSGHLHRLRTCAHWSARTRRFA